MKTVMNVKGTHCNSCKMLIEDVCSEIPGVKSCTVDYKTGKMVVEHDGTVDRNLLQKEIEKVGPYKIQKRDEK